MVSTTTPAPEDLLSYYGLDISLVVEGEGLQGGGGVVVPGLGGSVDDVQGVADRCDGQPVPGFGCGVLVGRNCPVLTSFRGIAAAELSRKWSWP